jgi:hypothetical protein
METEEKPVSVRMPSDLKEEIQKLANGSEGRSMNATVLLLLRLALNVHARSGGGRGKLLELIEMADKPTRVFAEYLTVGGAANKTHHG